jgi:hypothetical protein
MQEGQELVYQVTKITHQELVRDDTSRYQLKQVLANVEQGDGFELYRMELYVRANSNAVWQIDSVWSVKNEPQQIVQQESNIPYLKAVFPAYKSLFWDGHAYNRLGRKLYTVESIDEPYTVKGKVYEKAMAVVQSNTKSLLSKDSRLEVYSAGKGLVYKRWEVYQYINDSQSAFYGKDSIIGGVFYEQTLIQ